LLARQEGQQTPRCLQRYPVLGREGVGELRDGLQPEAAGRHPCLPDACEERNRGLLHAELLLREVGGQPTAQLVLAGLAGTGLKEPAGRRCRALGCDRAPKRLLVERRLTRRVERLAEELLGAAPRLRDVSESRRDLL